VPPQFISVQEFAARIDQHPHTVRKALVEGKIRGIRVARRFRIPIDEIDRLLKQGVK
jgi:excisionase family DNA binding protein